MKRAFAATIVGLVQCLPLLCAPVLATAQDDIVTTPSKQALAEASRDNCDGVSVIVRRCPPPVDDASRKAATDPLTKSRAATKAAFDRKDQRARAAALDGTPEAAADAPPVGAAQRLDAVNVEGTAEKPLSVEEVLQRALNPGPSGVPGPNGTVSHYAPDGMRYDCIQKCIGPACCVAVRSMPNPARDSNSIGR